MEAAVVESAVVGSHQLTVATRYSYGGAGPLTDSSG